MAYFQDGNEAMNALEAMVDATSLATVLFALESICHGKADHIRSNWQYRVTAKTWDNAAVKCNVTATKADV